MMRTLLVCVCSALLALVLGAGCAASYDKSAAPASPAAVPAPSQAPKETIPPPAAASDTVSVAVQQAQKPAYEASDPVKTDLVPGPTAKYCVQIGAYKLRENADVVASAAETRFARAVYTIHDAGTDLFKVMIGDFATKDEARSFRDRMVQQYPGEYKDAWVSELAK